MQDLVVTALGAGATVDNAIAGRDVEFVSSPARIDIGFVGSVADTTYRVTIGGRQVGRGTVSAWAIANRGPQIPDDIVISAIGLRGQRIVIELVAVTAATVRTFVRHRAL